MSFLLDLNYLGRLLIEDFFIKQDRDFEITLTIEVPS